MTPEPQHPPPFVPALAPPPSPSPAPPALDARALAKLHQLDPAGRLGVVRRVLCVYETSLQRMLDQLQVQLAPGAQADAALVSHVAHTLKSSSASVGALALAQACAETEKHGRQGATETLHADVVHLLAEGRAALLAVRAMLHD